MARHLHQKLLPEDRGDQVLGLIADVPRSGLELTRLLGVTPAELALIAYPLWHAQLLQGEASEGCCGRPGGTRCLSCRLDRRWCLTGKAASALKH